MKMSTDIDSSYSKITSSNHNPIDIPDAIPSDLLSSALTYLRTISSPPIGTQNFSSLGG